MSCISQHFWPTTLGTLGLLLLCAFGAAATQWNIDEGVIAIFIDGYKKSGELRFLFQHNNILMPFGWPHFFLLSVLQPFPLDPDFYFLSRAPAGLMIFISTLFIWFYVARQTGNYYLGLLAGFALGVLALGFHLFTARYDAPYLFGAAAVLLPLAYFPSAGRADPHSTAAFASVFLIALAINTLALASHPNGIGSYSSLGLVWILALSRLDQRQNVTIAAAFALSIAAAAIMLLRGRSPDQFLADLSVMQDSAHHFDFFRAVMAEYGKYKSLASNNWHPYSLLVYMLLLALARIVVQPSLLIRQPLYAVLLLQVIFLALQSAKWVFYQGLLIPGAVAVSFLIIGEMLTRLAPFFRGLPVAVCYVLLAAAILDTCMTTSRAMISGNTMMERLTAPEQQTFREIAALRKQLQGKTLNFYSDLTIMPIFSFLDITRHYRATFDPTNPDKPPARDMGQILICPVPSWSCDFLFKNKYAEHFVFTEITRLSMFNRTWQVIDVAPRGERP